MSVEVLPGGQRRIDRVLGAGFVAGVGGLALTELRARREEAEAEEADVSFLRRLLQGRLDILRVELVRRSRGGEQNVAGLPAILTDDAPGSSAAWSTTPSWARSAWPTSAARSTRAMPWWPATTPRPWWRCPSGRPLARAAAPD